MQHFHFLVANRVGSERAGWLHGRQRQQLHQVILEHVAQDARLLIVFAASLDANRFRGRDLDVRDVMTVPERLEDRVCEAENEDVLNTFLSEIVIDSVDLVLAKLIEDKPIERHR